jgi:hypothetical protein
MKIREFARHIGVSHPAVLKACANGRLTERSVRRDGRGRVVNIDPGEGAREWDRNKGRLAAAEMNGTRPVHGSRVHQSPAAEAAPRLVFGGLDELELPGAPFVGIRFPLDRFLAGAARALREAGREPTPDALRAVVAAVDDAAWWVAAFGALSAATAAEIPAEDLGAMWEAEGREAVLGEAQDGGDRGDA